jgi:hypothetical protein
MTRATIRWGLAVLLVGVSLSLAIGQSTPSPAKPRPDSDPATEGERLLKALFQDKVQAALVETRRAAQQKYDSVVEDARRLALEAQKLIKAMRDQLKEKPDDPDKAIALRRRMEDLEAQLIDKVTLAFDLREGLQRQELRELEERMRLIRERLDQRALNRTSIIKEQAAVLFQKGDIDWESKPARPSEPKSTGATPGMPPPTVTLPPVDPSIVTFPDDLAKLIRDANTGKDVAATRTILETRLALLKVQVEEGERQVGRLKAIGNAVSKEEMDRADYRLRQLQILLQLHQKLLDDHKNSWR